MTQEELQESESIAAPDALVEDDIHDDSAESVPVQHQPSLLAQIVGFFFRTPARRERERSRRLRELNVSLEYASDSPTLYVLRGELFLERKEYHLAQADFEMAVTIAEAFDPESGWGLVEQAMRDRALDGLSKVQLRLSE